MPKGPQGQKRPADVIGNAVHVMRIATGETYDTMVGTTDITMVGTIAGNFRNQVTYWPVATWCDAAVWSLTGEKRSSRVHRKSVAPDPNRTLRSANYCIAKGPFGIAAHASDIRLTENMEYPASEQIDLTPL
jgi:hypothetical protein